MNKLQDKHLYYVGGIVRDEMLGIKSIDTDYCYEGNAIQFSQNMHILKANPQFGTARILYKKQEIDIASTRTEFYPKAGHLPKIKTIACPLKEDLERRDFTINAMAKNTLSGEIIDYLGGQKDLRDKKLRILHDKSFIDDPTRILRGLKFSVRFGFDLEEHTKKLQNEYLANINYDMSYARIKKELKETFNLNKDIALHKFINDRIYKLLGKNQQIPDIKTSVEKFVNEFKPKHIWLVYIGMFDLTNISFTKEEAKIIEEYNKIKNKHPKNDPETYNLFCKVPLEAILLYGIEINPELSYNYLRNLRNIKIEVNGKDLLQLGIKQGEIYKKIFDYIRTKKIKNHNLSKQDEIQLIKEKFIK